jgi:hypothetical protein
MSKNQKDLKQLITGLVLMHMCVGARGGEEKELGEAGIFHEGISFYKF